MMTTTLHADDFGSMWKEYDNAKKKDMPQTKVDVLDKIISEAQRTANYGNLLKAETQRLIDISQISVDSIAPAMKRLELKEQKAEQTDKALAAVYSCVIADAYDNIATLSIADDKEKKQADYKRRALANPEALAKAKATDYIPFVTEGTDSQIFNNDLLSLIGYKMKEYELLTDFYKKAGNRRAAMQTELDGLKDKRNEFMPPSKYKDSKYIHALDGMIKEYGDLQECGIVAVERYSCMKEMEAKPAEMAAWLKASGKRWEKWENATRFKDLYKELTAPRFNAHLSYLLPEKTDTMDVSVRNVKELTLTITRLKMEGEINYVDFDGEKRQKNMQRFAIPSSKIVINKQTDIENAYDNKKIDIALPPLKAGIYLMEMNSERKEMKTQREIVVVSDVYAVRLPLPENKTRITVVSATTGQPIAGAKVDVWADGKDKAQHFTTNEMGEVIVGRNNSNINSIRAYTSTDNYMQEWESWGNFYYYGRREKGELSILFTDRGIYRPGQTVHASAVAYSTDGLHQYNVVTGRQIKMQLYDANRKVVEEKTVKTDEYGTAAADFTLPAGGHLNGKFSVSAEGCGSQSAYFSVEEYKRPTYEVEFDEVKQEYHNGDTVQITGRAKTYAGVPVQGATVRYSVTREKARLYWFESQYENKDEMYTDTVTTDGKGEFKLSVPVIMPEGYEELQDDDEFGSDSEGWLRIINYPSYYKFTAKATVTDIAGESHEGSTSLMLGTKPTALNFNLPDKILNDKPTKLTIKRMNASAKAIDGDVAYWFDNNKDRTYSVKANEEMTLDWQKLGLASGKHEMHATCGNDTVSSEFTLFSLTDKRPVVDTPDWAYISAQEFPRNGEPVQLQIGSSRPDTHIIYSIISGKKEIESGTYDISDSLLNLRFSYKEEYGEGLLLNFIWVKDGHAYTHMYTIKRPLEDKSLDMQWKTFRDKLTPGQKETWTLTIKRPERNDKINNREGETDKGIQLAAWMYDKSLDQIQRHSFVPNLWVYQQMPSTQWAYSNISSYGFSNELRVKWSDYRALTFSKFNYDLRELFYATLEYGSEMVNDADGSVVVGYGTRRPMMMAKMQIGAANIAKGIHVEEAIPMPDESVSLNKAVTIRGRGTAKPDTNDEQQSPAAMQLRENLNETAFFYPALYADKNGDAIIEFTLPESVTTWNFRSFAHDKYMNYGMLDGEAVASKKVMVMPNVPRFIRQGDKATIATRVANNSDEQLSATVRMELVDPETDKVVFTSSKKVSLDKNATESVCFEYQPSGTQSLLICRISAEGKAFSDGEQHYLPILPAMERIVNTLPFSINEKGEKTFDISSLFPKGSAERKLTVEYTANPTWLMIQALPYMAETNEKNAISLAAAYYANVLGRHIMQQAPVIKKVVELWRQEQQASSNDNSMMSQLEKNQELKQIILAETPWVMDADKETEQKRMLTTYFDESAMNYRIKSQLEALQKLQKSNGAWSWWEGMDGSPSMTAAVLQMFARLNVMAGTQQETKTMINRAMKYLGDFCVKEYEEIKKREKAGEPVYICDSHAIQYLYINTLLGRELPAKEKEMKNYLLSYLRNDRQRNIYSKALMAIILNNDGKKAEAKEYVESIRQYTVMKPEMGRYFDSPRASYSWFDYRIPTQTAAIEAIKSVEPNDKQTIDEMRLWLLQSKRTQAWDTPINSVNAIYAFLDGKYSKLGQASTSEAMAMTVDGKSIMTNKKASAGLGYTKTAVNVDNTTPKTLKITKRNDGTSWGAAYAQFCQNAADITDAASGIKITRTVIAPEGKDINSLSVGDRVKVRLTITADRDYDFVAVEDKRAACMEPANQTSGYGWGYYCSPKDNATNYYFDRLAKGKHIVETEYFIDRAGSYTTGTCSVQCAYSPEFCGREAAKKITVE